MTQAIAAVGAGIGQMQTPGGSVGALQAQLQKCQNQLADWVGCPSGKTPQGQAKIQQIQSQTASIKAQLARIETQKARQVAAAQAGTNPAAAPASGSGSAAPSTAASGASIGGVVDTFA
ncbi:MAG TPA: FlxA-like family protein [Bordetella sp.]|uniref:FlxA-like family protein n=1 Tax=Bordetella sp. TaxID=28081 RepID=UPI002ED289E3